MGLVFVEIFEGLEVEADCRLVVRQEGSADQAEGEEHRPQVHGVHLVAVILYCVTLPHLIKDYWIRETLIRGPVIRQWYV